MGRGRHPETGKKAVRGMLNRLRALELRARGWTLQRIAVDLGISRQAVHKAIKKELDLSIKRAAAMSDRQRELECVRLDGVIDALWDNKADPIVAAQILKAIQVRAQLHGLNAANKTELTGKDGGPIKASFADFVAAALQGE